MERTRNTASWTWSICLDLKCPYEISRWECWLTCSLDIEFLLWGWQLIDVLLRRLLGRGQGDVIWAALVQTQKGTYRGVCISNWKLTMCTKSIKCTRFVFMRLGSHGLSWFGYPCFIGIVFKNYLKKVEIIIFFGHVVSQPKTPLCSKVVIKWDLMDLQYH